MQFQNIGSPDVASNWKHPTAIYRYPGDIRYALADLRASLAAYATFLRIAKGGYG
jgi:hypothetical protein